MTSPEKKAIELTAGELPPRFATNSEDLGDDDEDFDEDDDLVEDREPDDDDERGGGINTKLTVLTAIR